METYKKTKFYQLICHYLLFQRVFLIIGALGPCLICIINFVFSATGEVFFVVGEASNNFNPAISESFDFGNNYKFICSDTDEKQKFFSNIGPWFALGAVIGVAGYFLWKWLKQKPSSDGSGNSRGNSSSNSDGAATSSGVSSEPKSEITELLPAVDSTVLPILDKYKSYVANEKWSLLTKKMIKAGCDKVISADGRREIAASSDAAWGAFLFFYKEVTAAILASGTALAFPEFMELAKAIIDVSLNVFYDNPDMFDRSTAFVETNFRFKNYAILFLKVLCMSKKRKAALESFDASIAFQRRLFKLGQDCRDRSWSSNSYIRSYKRKNF